MSHRLLSDNYFSEWLGPCFKLTYRFVTRPTIRKIKILDLHGKTLNQAYELCNEFIYDHYTSNTKNITIITGKSGLINKEFIMWLETNRYVKSYRKLPNEGSYKLTLKKG